MKTLKHELQDIICRDEQAGATGQLKKVQLFLKRYAETSIGVEEKQRIKGEKTALLAFAASENLFYRPTISESNFIGEGAEQKVFVTMVLMC